MGTSKTMQSKYEWMMQTIKHFFLNDPEGVGVIDRGKLLAEFALANFTTERIGKDILRVLEKTLYIRVKGNDIFQRK